MNGMAAAMKKASCAMEEIRGIDAASTPTPLGHPECGSFPAAEPEIKLVTNSRGGARPGAGRPRKAPIAIMPPRPFPPDARWYCAEVVGGRDSIAGEQLRLLGFAVHIPMLVAVDQPRHFVCGPMFPGYVFVGLETDTASGLPLAWTRLFEAPAVIDLLRRPDGAPQALPTGIVEDLIGRGDPRGRITLPVARETMIAGASVEVSDGPFAGHRAKVITASRDWVKLLMTFFGRDAEVVVARNAVETV